MLCYEFCVAYLINREDHFGDRKERSKATDGTNTAHRTTVIHIVHEVCEPKGISRNEPLGASTVKGQKAAPFLNKIKNR